MQVDKKYLQSFGKRKVEKVRKSEQIQQIKQEQRDNALASFWSKGLDAATILEKMDEMEDNEEEKELAELEARLFGTNYLSRSWKSRMIWMSWMSSQSWKQKCSGSKNS